MERKNKKIVSIEIAILVLFIFSYGSLALTQAQSNEQNTGGETVSVTDVTVCCEKTKSGLYCQDAKEEMCDTSNGLRKLPTSCRSSSFCNPGYCFDSEEGTCLDKTPQVVCNKEGGTWSATKPEQCNLGCCILGEQGSFVTLTRCKRLSSFYGLETNFNPNIDNQEACILIAAGKEKGACVFIKDFERTCKLTTREDCTSENMYGETAKKIEETQQQGQQAQQSGTVTGQAVENSQELKEGEVKFYTGRLCSAEELGTNCGPSKQTTCVAGKEEVYFVDTCGNVANIYDAKKINDDAYWSKILDKSEACNANSANENSLTCGNCNYLMGSYCREATTIRPTYGNYMCASLNCKEENGKQRLHGESWCGFDVQRDFSPVKQTTGDSFSMVLQQALSNIQAKKQIPTAFYDSKAPVGSKFYRYQCNNGKIIVEPCADFRQEECIEDSINTQQGKFSEAACRVNRWQDCTAQKEQASCENSDKRDCKWLAGIEYVLIGAVVGTENGSTLEGSSLAQIQQGIKQSGGLKNIPKGACVPKNPPGLRFWEGNEAAAVCAQANAICPVTYEKGLTGGEWNCIKNCECLDESVQLKRVQLCTSLADCGPKTNIVGKIGNTKGYKIIEEDLKKKD